MRSPGLFAACALTACGLLAGGAHASDEGLVPKGHTPSVGYVPGGPPRPASRPMPAFRTPVDVYPVVLSARISERLPVLTTEALGGREATKLSARVRIVLDARGAVTLAELERGSGLAAFDSATIETLSQFGGASSPFGALPLPKDAERLNLISTRGLSVDVRPALPRKAAVAPKSSVKEP